MKVRRQLAALEPMVLGPMHGVTGDVWHRAPKSKWSLAQIVAHLALSVDLSSSVFERRAEKQDMIRRSTPGQSVLRHLYLGLGRYPAGRKAPESTQPSEHPDSDLMVAQFRMGVERFTTLLDTWPDKRQLEVFVQHPLLGDLNLPEWVRFHYVHCRHHARQIRDRLRWLRRETRDERRET